MAKKRTTNKAIRPNASAPTKLGTRDSFQNFQARIGYGTGNLSDGGNYAVDFLSRNRGRLDAMYRSSWICGKAVDCIAEDMTKRGIDIKSDEVQPGDEDELMRSWKTQHIWDRLSDSIKWARLYGGAVAVLLIDGQRFDTPLRVETIGEKQFKGIAVLDRWQVQPSLNQLVTQLGPHIGLPEYYEITGNNFSLPVSTRIHYTRIIRFEGAELPYWQRVSEQLWGQSVLERLFDRLLAFDSTTQGIAQLAYKAHLRTYKVKNLREVIALGGPPLEGLIKQIEFVRSTQTNEGLTLMDSEDEFEANQYSFAGLDLVLLQFGQQISGSLDIPLTRLFGQSPAGMNSTGESDLRTYYDGIEQQQERRLRAGIDKLLRVSYQSRFGRPWPDSADFTFRPLWQLSDVEKGTIASSVTTAVNASFSAGLVGRQTALKELRASSRVTGVWANISDETIKQADDDVAPAMGELGGDVELDENGYPTLADPDDEEGEDSKAKKKAA